MWSFKLNLASRYRGHTLCFARCFQQGDPWQYEQSVRIPAAADHDNGILPGVDVLHHRDCADLRRRRRRFIRCGRLHGVNNTKPLVIGQTFMAGSTDPTSGSTAWALTSHGIAEKLFTVNRQGDVVPQVAEWITRLGASSWEVKLRSGYRFSDGTDVTAQKVADAMNQINTANAGSAQASAGSLTWQAASDGADDKVTVVSERDTPVMEAVLAEWCFAVFKNETVGTSGQIMTVFTGPFEVDEFDAGDKIVLQPNSYYPGAADRDPVILRKFSSGEEVAEALESGALDMGFHLPATHLEKMRQQGDITVKSFEVGYHYMMWHNIRRSPLSDLSVRKAVDLALDRSQLAQTLLGGDPTRSLFPANTPWTRLDEQPHADKSGAEELLDKAGWSLDSSGRRKKDGACLTLTVVAYPQRPGLALMLPVVTQQLESLGITVDAVLTDGSSWDQLDQIMADKDYDLLMWAQNTLPAGDPQWFFNAFFHSEGGSNHAGLESAAVDAALEEMGTSAIFLPSDDAHGHRVEKALAAHNAILDEVPVSNLMTPAWHVGLSARMADYEPWSSDYYVIREDLKPLLHVPEECVQVVLEASGALIIGIISRSMLSLAMVVALAVLGHYEVI